MKPCRVIAARLSREGYGSAIELLDAPVSLVLDFLAHAQFTDDYGRAYAELNKNTEK